MSKKTGRRPKSRSGTGVSTGRSGFVLLTAYIAASAARSRSCSLEASSGKTRFTITASVTYP